MSCKSYVEISNICKDRLPVFSMYLLKQLNVECNVNFSCLALSTDQQRLKSSSLQSHMARERNTRTRS